MGRLTNAWRIGCNLNAFIDVSKSVVDAIASQKPVVALETTIITHGMPFPQNERVAISVEDVVRQQGAVPATIGIIDGRIKVGLDPTSLSKLADPKVKKLKISKRDLPYALSQGLTGGTTVAATVFISNLMGIDVFATGGIGGVHRDVNETMDVSADLLELSRNPILVVSAGVKSILDIGRTLEYMETCGICVVTYGAGTEFPAFVTRSSGFCSPYNVSSEEEAARLIYTSQQLGNESGILLAVPIPTKYSLDEKKMQEAIEKAMTEAKEKVIKGKKLTPFLLDRVRTYTAGDSLNSNMSLIVNNASIAGRVAVKLSEMKKRISSSVIQGRNDGDSLDRRLSKKVVSIGGAILDVLLYPNVELVETDCTTVEIRKSTPHFPSVDF